MKQNLMGRCGLYCGVCEVYRAYKDSKELQKELAKKHNCLPQEVRCEGCQAIRRILTVGVYGWSYDKEWGTNCKILKCLDSKKLKFCYECAEYDSCERFDKFGEICLGISLDLRKNWKTIRDGKTEEWLWEQDKNWRCPQCGNPIIVSYDFKNSHWYGNKLRK